MDEEDLFPVFDVPSEDDEDEEESAQYNPAPLWDFKAGDFVTDEAHRALYGSGYDAWVLWCTKTILTQRFAHLAYGDNAGIEAEEAFEEGEADAVESAFERTITEALLADPMGRTIAVKDFEFEWEADSLWISCVVVGDDGSTADIKAKLNT